MKDLKELIKTYSIIPNAERDQNFIVDRYVIRSIVDVAKVTKEDRVLEIGAGLGFLTRELASRAKEVIAIEIDKQFEPILKSFSDNVEVIYGDAYKLLNDRGFLSKMKPPTKTVSSIPYSKAQNMLHNYTNTDWYQGDLVWLAPASLVNRVNNEPILGAYFSAEFIELVPKTAFYPQPNTSSAIVDFRRISDPDESKDFEIYFRRWLYNHEEWKVKNAIREGLIQAAYDLAGAIVTKNQARQLISALEIPDKELNRLTSNIRPEYYFNIPKKLNKWFASL